MNKMAVLFAAFVITGVLSLSLYDRVSSGVPGTVWLPDAAFAKTDDDVLFDLPTQSTVVTTPYGKAVVYTSSESWGVMYALRTSSKLRVSACPNIAKFETLLPSDCKRLGYFKDEPVYAINRSLPSGATEYFVELGGAFVLIKERGDGQQSLNYLNTFIPMLRSQAGDYLAKNSTRVAAIQAKRKAAQQTEDRKDAEAHKKLPYNPALPSTAIAGWEGEARGHTEIDGPNAEHPRMVRVYYDKGKDGYMEVFVMPLADARIGAVCGPTPTQGMKDLSCWKVPGTDMYEAIITGTHNDLFRYVYYPVGDSLVITFIAEYARNGQLPSWPAERVDLQNRFTASARPVDKSKLKGAIYSKLFY